MKRKFDFKTIEVRRFAGKNSLYTVVWNKMIGFNTLEAG